jgi:hypothetical protein
VDLQWKEKTDDQRRESFGFVKHFHVGYWAMPLALWALASAFLQANTTRYIASGFTEYRIFVPIVVWRILAVISAGNWAIFFCLQVRFALCCSYSFETAAPGV